MILLITFPPDPITSLIFSGFIVIAMIFGAYFDTSLRGSGIAFNITSLIIIFLAICVFSNASLIIS